MNYGHQALEEGREPLANRGWTVLGLAGLSWVPILLAAVEVMARLS